VLCLEGAHSAFRTGAESPGIGNSRRGHHASAKFWRRVLLPVLARHRVLDIPKFCQGGAAFAGPRLLLTGTSPRTCTVGRPKWRQRLAFRVLAKSVA
jgi:hypothetical protein